MSKQFYQLFWDSPDIDGIALNQEVNPVIFLNGVLANINPQGGDNSVSFKDAGFDYARVVSLTSVNDVSLQQITINGFLYGRPVSETIAGPNNNTVETTQEFDVITSVTCNPGDPLLFMSVGTGTTGHIRWIYTGNRNNSVGAIQIIVKNTINYSIQGTLTDPVDNKDGEIFSFDPFPFPSAAFTNATISQFAGPINIIAKYVRLIVNSSTDGRLDFNINIGKENP